MPQYRVPLSGSLLVEADTEQEASIAAHMWTVPMYQATHGVALQAIPPEVRAANLDILPHDISDVTIDFPSVIERAKRHLSPVMQRVAAKLTNYFVGLQADWQLYEFQKRLPRAETDPYA